MKFKVNVAWKKLGLKILVSIVTIILTHAFLQLMQNNLDWTLVYNFIFSWHTEKFLLSTGVLIVCYLLILSLIGNYWFSNFFFAAVMIILGIADYLKMSYRLEPIYPDDLMMVFEPEMMRDLTSPWLFYPAVFLIIMLLSFVVFKIYQSRKLSKTWQIIRISCLIITSLSCWYIGHFNSGDNWLRKQYDRTAYWISYSQKMNYYNTGVVAGFLYNLNVPSMDQPTGYSKKAIDEIVAKYQVKMENDNESEQPNIIYVMSESFSDSSRLNGIDILSGDPLNAFRTIQQQNIGGQMLSQNYGGGTANIEFEALTSFSMEPMNSQMTTPYTMLVPKMTNLPSIVSLTNNYGYQTTAIHPYNTSMYKRQDVYDVMGFNKFITEDNIEYQEKIDNNPYIDDESGYKAILDILADETTPQFIHYVTMQTHMPYNDKYSELNYPIAANSLVDQKNVENYLQDVAYSSEAFADFIAELSKVKRHTIVVFWGDHLPSLYSEELQQANDENKLHETEYVIVDNQSRTTEHSAKSKVTSPIYFTPEVLEIADLQTPGFYRMLLELQEVLPAFEKLFYYNGTEYQQTLALSKEDEQVYKDYVMIQYDILNGEQYSLQSKFFTK